MVSVKTTPNAHKFHRGRLAFVAVAGVLLGFFALLFFVANDTWVVIHIPSIPWTTKPFSWAFEAHLAAIISACFFSGIFLAFSLFPIFLSQIQLQKQDLELKTQELEKELKSIERLVESLRNSR